LFPSLQRMTAASEPEPPSATLLNPFQKSSEKARSGGILGAEMRRLVLLGAGVLGLVVLLTATAEPSAPAAVRVSERDPLTLAGQHFKSGERVRLVVTLNRTTRTHKVRAGSSGTFHSAFEGMKWKRGAGTLKVEATGSRGSHVAWTVVALDPPEATGLR
jgi:hypothetical protein